MAIRFKKVSHQYAPKTPMAFLALKDVDLDIEVGKMTAIIGATGSGKSTLVQHLNALLLPSSGQLEVNDKIIMANKKPKGIKALRKQVGLVFQFPEYQLFEETIERDLCFGPLNFGKTPTEAVALAKASLKMVNIAESFLERSPLDISGGQKRKVAIAGILAIEPDILVLDEPTAGLDPAGVQEMMKLFKTLNTQYHKTIILVTHDFDNVIHYCDNVVVLASGEVVYHDRVSALFSDDGLLDKFGIYPPALIRLQRQLKARGIKLTKVCLRDEELIAELRSQTR